MSPISVKKSDIVLPILLVFLTIFPPSLGLSSESGQHQKPTVFFNSVTENFRGTIVRPGNWDPITQSLIQMGSLALIGHHYISFEEEAIRTGENYLLKGGRLNRNVVRDLSYLDIVLKMNDSLSNWFVSVDPNPEGLMRSLGLLRDTPHGLAVRVFFHDELNEEQLIDKIFELKTLCQRFVGFSGSEEDFKNTSPQELLQYVKTTLSTASGSRSRFVNLDNQNIYQIKTGTWQVNGLKVPEHEQNNPRTSKLHNLSDGLHAILTTMRLVGADWKRRAHFMPEILAVRSGRDDSYVVRYMGSKDGSIWIPGYFFLLDGKKFNKEDQTVWKKFAMQDYISNARPIVLDLWARRLAQANLKAAVRANHWQNIYVKVDPTQGQVLDVQIIDGNDIRLSERAISEASTSIPTGYNSTIWTKPQAKGHESFIELHKQPQSEIEAYKFGLAALDELKIRLGLPFAVPARAFHFWAHHTHAGGEIALRMVVDRPDNLIEVCDNHPQICEQLGKTTQISQWLNVAHHWSEKGGTYRSAVHDIVKSFLTSPSFLWGISTIEPATLDEFAELANIPIHQEALTGHVSTEDILKFLSLERVQLSPVRKGMKEEKKLKNTIDRGKNYNFLSFDQDLQLIQSGEVVRKDLAQRILADPRLLVEMRDYLDTNTVKLSLSQNTIEDIDQVFEIKWDSFSRGTLAIKIALAAASIQMQQNPNSDLDAIPEIVTHLIKTSEYKSETSRDIAHGLSKVVREISYKIENHEVPSKDFLITFLRVLKKLEAEQLLQSERVYNLAFELIMSTDPMEKAGYDFGQIPQELFDYALNRFWLHYLGQSQINRTQPLFAMIKVVPERLLDRAIYHGLRAMVFNSSETTLQKLVNSIKGKELYAWEKALDRSIKKKVVESIRGQLMTLRSEFNEVGESDSFKNRRDQQKSNLEFLEAEFSSKGFWGLKLRIECEEKLK